MGGHSVCISWGAASVISINHPTLMREITAVCVILAVIAVFGRVMMCVISRSHPSPLFNPSLPSFPSAPTLPPVSPWITTASIATATTAASVATAAATRNCRPARRPQFESTPPPPVAHMETPIEARARRKAAREAKAAAALAASIAAWAPRSDLAATKDAYKTLFVGRLAYETSERKLEREMAAFGTVLGEWSGEITRLLMEIYRYWQC